MTEKYFFGSFWKINKKIRLEIAPKRLRKKVGAIKEPTNILDTKTLISDTQTAVCKLNFTKVYKIIILAIPGFTPGMGLGRKNSIIDNTIAIAASLAMKWSSVFVLIVNGVITLTTISNGDSDLIW